MKKAIFFYLLITFTAIPFSSFARWSERETAKNFKQYGDKLKPEEQEAISSYLDYLNQEKDRNKEKDEIVFLKVLPYLRKLNLIRIQEEWKKSPTPSLPLDASNSQREQWQKIKTAISNLMDPDFFTHTRAVRELSDCGILSIPYLYAVKDKPRETMGSADPVDDVALFSIFVRQRDKITVPWLLEQIDIYREWPAFKIKAIDEFMTRNKEKTLGEHRSEVIAALQRLTTDKNYDVQQKATRALLELKK